ncbi:MAG: hypothetical protein U0869_04995 [Chloroflexota bacterium]
MNQIHYRQLSIVGAFGGSPLWFRRAVDWLAATDTDLDRFVLDRFRCRMRWRPSTTSARDAD